MLGKEPQEKLEIKLCPDGSGQLYVPGLTEFSVQSVEDINKVGGDGAGGSGSQEGCTGGAMNYEGCLVYDPQIQEYF